MVETSLVLAALAPLVVVATLLIGLLWPAVKSMPVAWATAAVVGATVWGMPIEWVFATSLWGVLLAIEILWIVFGALVLLYTLMQVGAIDKINEGFAAISEDRRIQVILLGFFMATFLEGVAGFGTPAAVVAPLLLALGFPAMAAVVAALVGHSIATTFGAVGVPVNPGIQGPLDAAGTLSDMELSELVAQATATGALYQAVFGIAMPLLTVGMVVYFFGDPDERSLEPVWEVLPLCLFSGVAFVVPFTLTAVFVGPEFPSILGSMVGILVVVATLRAGYFVPEEDWTFPDRDEWPDYWVGSVEPGGSSDDQTTSSVTVDQRSMSLLRAWSPYLLLVILLIITRDFTPIGELLTDHPIFAPTWDGILGTTIVQGIEWAYVPGTWLLASALIAIPVFGMTKQQVTSAWREAGQTIRTPAIALVFVIGMVGIMLESGQYPEAPGGDSMLVVLADGTATLFGEFYTVVAVPVGILGTFITGSITVSNITFTGLQFEVATQAGLPEHVIVGAQMVGGAIGNVIAIHNVIAALATVGLVGKEGRVIRLNLIPVLFYIIVGAILVTAAAVLA